MDLNQLLKEELKLSAGCTEPAAIAYAAAFAKEKLGDDKVERVVLGLSSNVLKNALCVSIPGTNKSGVKLIVLLGMLFGKSEHKLTILKDIGKQDIERVCELVDSFDVEVRTVENAPALYIEVELVSKGNFSKVVIEHTHDIIKSYQTKHESVVLHTQQAQQLEAYNYSFDDAYYFVKNRKFDRELIKTVRNTNNEIAEYGLTHNCGLNIGKVNTQIGFISPQYRNILAKTVAGIDARMSGTSKNVMINSGSGNQGITATIPVLEMARVLGASEDEELAAIALSHLTAIHIRSKQGKLSSSCGAVCACIGTAAGITYLLGGTKEQIEGTIKNLLCSSFGLFCDGAKTSCALKINACLLAAVHTSFMAMQNLYINENSGVISKSLEQTLQHLNEIESKFTQSMDETIMNISIKNLQGG